MQPSALQQGNAAEAEDRLLTEPVVGVAAVEMVGKMAVPFVVAFDVGVEQEDGDDVAGDADDVEAPGADENFASLHGQSDDSVSAGQGGFRRPGNVCLGLLALIVEALAEVAATMDERDCDHGTAGVGRGAESVASQHAQTTGVGGKGRRESYLHGKVGDSARGEIGCGGGERVGKAQVVFPFLIRIVADRP